MVIDALGELERDHVTNKGNILVVRYNPWWFSEQQNLTRSFFNEVSAALGTKVSSRVRKGMKKLAKRVAGTKDLVSALLDFVPGGKLVHAAAGTALSAAGEDFGKEPSL